ncbi:unnamed protein product [Mytilus edulis]|uniref:Temptin Cys/Cys disulfide domain-containing protein n=1 Tax=Mytilus edulis TaxID=6550 RepID=A0A8S3TPX6_MYTED|nr:unnamed protein product [Mytilus edulis]
MFLLILCLVLTTGVLGFPWFRNDIPNGYKVPDPCTGQTGQIWEGVGHNQEPGGGPRNPFGLDFKTVGFKWTKELCQKDSDKDGRTNGEELGDPGCTWTKGGTPSAAASGHPGGFHADLKKIFFFVYVSCQVRDSDLDEFFRHENQAYPPSLSQFGQLRLSSKSDLLVSLEKMCVIVTEIPDVDAIILDGAVIVNILKPRFCKTFEDYSKQDSLKASNRGKRGKGIRRRVQADSTIPGNWESFLRIDDNKTELFAYLAEQLLTLTPSVQTTVVSTKGSKVVCNKPDKNNGNLSLCNHEAADTRTLLHVGIAVKSGMQKIMIRTVDTDVVVIAVSAVHKLNITCLWMAFGVGINFRYIPVHEIALFMGPSKSNALLFFNAFSGCDQVSSFSNRGKKTAWDTWLSFDAVTEDFKLLSDKPNEDCVNEAALNIERFVVLMYDRTSECLGVDAA